MPCALDGCDVEIEQPDKGPQRKFCCPAHRTAARSARLRTANAAAAAPPGGPGSPEPDTASAAVPEPTAPGPVNGEPRDVSEKAADQLPAPRPTADAELDAPTAPSTAGSSHGAQDDATPTSVHPSSPAPPVARPAAPAGVRHSAPPALRRAVPLRAVRKPFPIRGRSVVAAGLVFALALGGGASVLEGSGDPSTSPASEAPPLPPAGSRWAVDANVALASVARQLDEARASEARFTDAARASEGARPAAYNALVERRLTLERTRLLLEAQLGAWHNLQNTQAALAMAQGQLADIDRVTRGPARTSPSSDQLGDQRRRLSGQVDLLRDQVGRWQQDVDIAVAGPAPNPADTTKPLTQQVDSLTERRRQGLPDGPANQGPLGPGGREPLALGREPGSGDRDVDLPGTGAPPEPGRDRASVASGAGSTGDASRSRGSVVGDAGRAVDSAGRATRDAVGSAAEGLGEALDGSSRSSDRDGPDRNSDRSAPGARLLPSLVAAVSDDGPSSERSERSESDSSTQGRTDGAGDRRERSDRSRGEGRAPRADVGRVIERALGAGSDDAPSDDGTTGRAERSGTPTVRTAPDESTDSESRSRVADAVDGARTALSGASADRRGRATAATTGGEQGSDRESTRDGEGSRATDRSTAMRAVVERATGSMSRREGARSTSDSTSTEPSSRSSRGSADDSEARRGSGRGSRAAESGSDRNSPRSSASRDSSSRSGRDGSARRSSSEGRSLGEAIRKSVGSSVERALSRASSKSSSSDGESSARSSSKRSSSERSSSERGSSRNGASARTTKRSSSESDSSKSDSSKSSSAKSSSAKSSSAKSSSAKSSSAKSSSSKSSSSKSSSAKSSSSKSSSAKSSSSKSSSAKSSSSKSSSAKSSSAKSSSAKSSSAKSSSSKSSSSKSSSAGD